jgi:hypothetical protein
VQLEDHLGVRLADELHATRFEAGAQLGVVVDLAVVDDRVAAVLGDHRLMAERRQVDDGQPALGEAERPVGHLTRIVGAAMRERIAHPRQPIRIAILMRPEDADDSAHSWRSSRGRCRFPRSPT